MSAVVFPRIYQCSVVSAQCSMLKTLLCLDSADIAASRRRELDVPKSVAAALGKSALEAASTGYYVHGASERVDWRRGVQAACKLYRTIVGDPMYVEHRKRSRAASTDWAIYSPDVPAFRLDDGTELERPWRLSFITCAAPYAPAVGQPAAGDLLRHRIHRVLAIARAHGHSALVLGARGSGAFGNDAHRTARDFRNALENDFTGAFSDVVFAITDWSPERKFLGPFRDVFASGDE